MAIAKKAKSFYEKTLIEKQECFMIKHRLKKQQHFLIHCSKRLDHRSMNIVPQS
jgi:hypothetical protein